ncbi:MAG: RecX family transcriptional regulator [Rhodospirillales bacterium]|nr:RecX family transcriptional regulator [Rhodospirillales bacterium]
MTAPPDDAALHDAALAHLARYATTEANLRRVLFRRIDRWSRAAEGEPEAIADAVRAARAAADRVVGRLVSAGAVSDAAFAESRARSLVRAGRSRRAIAATLAAKGVPSELAQAAAPDDPEAELGAALTLARRRRLGPFRTGEADLAQRQKELAILARAGFSQDVARRALAMEAAEAEERVLALRR